MCSILTAVPTYSITVNITILVNNVIALVKTDYNGLFSDFAVDCIPGNDK